MSKKRKNSNYKNDIGTASEEKATPKIPIQKIVIISAVALLIIGIIVAIAILSQPKEFVLKDSGPVPDVAYVEMDFGGYGKIILELDGKEAPITTKNFLDLVYSDFYNGLTIFRAQRGFVIQGGENKEIDLTPIKGEFSSNGIENNITHIRGVISMARTNDPNSATSQFFITLDDSAAYSLDGRYAGFGRVIEGMDVVDSIANDLFKYGGYMGFVDEAYAIEIKSAKIIDYKK